MSGAGRPVVALLSPLAAHHRAALAEHAEVVAADRVDALPADARSRCRVVVLRSGPRLGATELALLPALTDVVRPGSGTDNIDVAVMGESGIALHRNAEASAAAVAELALAGLTVLCRRMGTGYRWLLEGHYAKQRLAGELARAQRVAVWGAGPVGRAVFELARRLEMSVAHVAHPSVPAGRPVLTRSDALAHCDAHVLAVPLRPATVGMVGREWLARAAARRPYLVNVARYELLDTEAVTEALLADRLRGVYIDPVDADDLPRLRVFLDRTREHNVFVTQHQGAQCADVRDSLDGWAVDVVRAALAGSEDMSNEARRASRADSSNSSNR